jgi:hypothetical protein
LFKQFVSLKGIAQSYFTVGIATLLFSRHYFLDGIKFGQYIPFIDAGLRRYTGGRPGETTQGNGQYL